MKIRTLSALALLVATTAACDGTDAVQSYLQSLPGWAEFSPQRSSEDVELEKSDAVRQLFDGKTYTCKTAKHSLTANPDEIVIYQPDRNTLWPGSLLQGKGYLGGIGTLRELPIRQRAPVTIFIDLLGEDVTETVDSPDAASLQSAIGRLIAKAKTQGVPPQLRASFTTTSYDHTTQASLKLSMSAKFFGKASVEAQLNRMRESNETAVMADLKASAFTVTVVAPQTPSAFFSPDFNKARLDEQIALGNLGPDNIPVYVASITYGKRFLYNTISKSSTTDVLAALNASLDWKLFAGSASLQSHYRDVLKQSQIGIVAIGGSEEQLRSAISSDQGLKAYFETDTKIDEWVPISYEVRNLGDGSIAKMSETTTYNLRECVPGDGKVHKFEVQLAGVYRLASATIEHSDGSAESVIQAGEGDSAVVDVSKAMMGPGDHLVIGNLGGVPCLTCRWQREVTARVWVDGALLQNVTSGCKGRDCHQAPRAIVFEVDKTTGKVALTERI